MFSFRYTGHWEATPYEGFNYLVTYPEDKTALASTSGVNSCREYFIKRIRGIIQKSDADDPRVAKAYALVSSGRPYDQFFDDRVAKFDKEMKLSLQIINSFEKAHKWPLTRLYPVKSVGPRKIPFMFFIGHRKWTMNAYYMSMWTLMIRMGRLENFPTKILGMKHDRMVEELFKKSKNGSGDWYQVYYTIRRWDEFMSFYHGLSKGRSRKWFWSQARLGHGNSRPEGIQKMVSGTTYFKELRNEYIELRRINKTK